MSHYKNSAADIPLKGISITERVFSNLVNRPDEVVLVDGLTGQSVTAADFMDQVKRLAGGLTRCAKIVDALLAGIGITNSGLDNKHKLLVFPLYK